MENKKKQGREALTKRYFNFLESKANKFAHGVLEYITWDENSFPMTLKFDLDGLLSFADTLGFTLVKDCYEKKLSNTLNSYTIPFLEQRTGICMELIFGTYGVVPQDKEKIKYEVAFQVMGLDQEGIQYQYEYLIAQNQVCRVNEEEFG